MWGKNAIMPQFQPNFRILGALVFILLYLSRPNLAENGRPTVYAYTPNFTWICSLYHLPGTKNGNFVQMFNNSLRVSCTRLVSYMISTSLVLYNSVLGVHWVDLGHESLHLRHTFTTYFTPGGGRSSPDRTCGKAGTNAVRKLREACSLYVDGTGNWSDWRNLMYANMKLYGEKCPRIFN